MHVTVASEVISHAGSREMWRRTGARDNPRTKRRRHGYTSSSSSSLQDGQYICRDSASESHKYIADRYPVAYRDHRRVDVRLIPSADSDPQRPLIAELRSDSRQ